MPHEASIPADTATVVLDASLRLLGWGPSGDVLGLRCRKTCARPPPRHGPLVGKKTTVPVLKHELVGVDLNMSPAEQRQVHLHKARAPTFN